MIQLSVQVTYRKQFVVGLILISVFLLAIELIAQIYLSQNDSCYQELEQSEIYAGKSEKFLKQIWDSYHSLLFLLLIYTILGIYLSITTGISHDEHHEQLNWQVNIAAIKNF